MDCDFGKMVFSDPEKNIEQFDLQSGAKVADLGAGAGFYSFAAARAVGGTGRVYAIEVQKELLERIRSEAVRRGLGNIEAVWGNIEELEGTKLKDDSVDAVIVANVLFQIEKKKDFADEIRRILKPRGKILLVDWQDSYGGIGPDSGSVVDRAVAKNIFEGSGFSLEREIRAGSHHWGLVMRKI